MIRAIFFDFYGVWTPDTIGLYLDEVRKYGPAAEESAHQAVRAYYSGQSGPVELADTFRSILNRPDIESTDFMLNEASIYPAITNFMRGLHGHFIKLGVIANLGANELGMLNHFNSQTQVFELIGGPLAFGMTDQNLLSQQIFARALQQIGEPPRSTLVISGNPDYLAFASSLEIATLPYEGYPKLQQALEQRLQAEN